MRSLIVILVCLFSTQAHADEDITIRVIEQKYATVWTFFQMSFDGILKREVEIDGETFQAQQWGGGLAMMSTRRGDMQTRFRMEGRQVVLPENQGKVNYLIWQLGAQYYPRKPTIRLGSLSTRLTFGGLGGGGFCAFNDYYIVPNMEFNAGFSFTTGNELSSVYALAVYRPLGESLGDTIPQPGWSIRLGIQFPPAPSTVPVN
ncbi:MAG: hypothetical protein OYM47_20110 [Gemmatimonadota bacterium]|nr:hypothetical protein [Gemmatimonadota bacterium]